MRTRRVLLIGMMASGKTTVGRVVAQRLGCDYVDNDEMVLRATGHMLKDLLDRVGEQGLREAESAAMVEAIRTPPPVVAGIAAGVVTVEEDRLRLRDADAYVVWVTAAPAVLARRVQDGPPRPWLGDDPLGWFERTLAERGAWYREVADEIVDTGTLSPQECAARVLAGLGPPD